jgi:hemolysin activation/secretion protein
VRIESSSRILTTLGLTLRHQRPLWGGQLNASLGWEQGLLAFGAEDFAAQPVGTPNAQFGLATASLRLTRPWQLAHGAITYTGTIKGQWSDDRLYGTQQMSLGGSSSVHGSKSGLLSGNRGVLWRNELSYTLANAPTALGRLSLYAGADIGRIVPQAAYSITGGNIAGAVIGIRASGGWADFDLSYQQIVLASSSVTIPEGVFLFSLSRKF